MNIENNNPSITVIIPAYGCQKTIDRCIEAILNSSYLPNEVLIIDDCSPDETAARVKVWEERYSNIVRLISAKENGGPAKARNLGVSEANSEYLFFLDSDTEILPDALELFVQRIKTAGVEAVVGIYYLEPLNDGASPWYKALLYGYLHHKFGVQKFDQFSASCAGISKKIYEKVGGYNEWFPAGVDLENEEFGHRVSNECEMIIDPSIQAKHHFPGFKKMTSTFFFRTMLWVEMFSVRRRFNKSTNSSSVGVSSMALLAALFFLPLSFLLPFGYVPSVIFYLIYLYGYGGFLLFVLKKYPKLFGKMFMLNIYYTLVIALGACYGTLKVLMNKSSIVKEFNKKQQPDNG